MVCVLWTTGTLYMERFVELVKRKIVRQISETDEFELERLVEEDEDLKSLFDFLFVSNNESERNNNSDAMSAYNSILSKIKGH